MKSEAYSKKKAVGFGLVTIASIATISSASYDKNSITSSNNQALNYAAIVQCNDYDGEICVSSAMSELVCGEVFTPYMNNSDELNLDHPKINMQLKITKIKKHVSNFELEEEYEEI